MGSLAFWGGVKGAAGATKEHLVRRDEEEIANRKMAIDEARQVRLQKMRDTAQMARQETGQYFKAGESELERGQDTSERTGGEGFKAGEAERQRQFDAVQQDKAEASSEKIAGIRASEKDKTAGKWKITKTKGKGTIDPETNMPTEGGEIITITSPDTGNSYVQQGAKFVPQGGNEEMRQPAKREEAMKALYADPKRWADTFLNEYHWLPSDLMRYIPK